MEFAEEVWHLEKTRDLTGVVTKDCELLVGFLRHRHDCILKPPIDTIHAMAMILGLKICFAPPVNIWGFFSTSLIEDSFECLSCSIFVLSASAGFSVAEAISIQRGEKNWIESTWRGGSTTYKPFLQRAKTPQQSSAPQCRHISAGLLFAWVPQCTRAFHPGKPC